MDIAHYESQQGGPPAYSPPSFRHHHTIDPNLESDRVSAQANGRPQLNVYSNAASQLVHHQHDALAAHQIPASFYGHIRGSSVASSAPSNADASPRFSVAVPSGQQRPLVTSFLPEDRALPSTDVAENTIDDAYAAFILYCNPTFPASIDTSELVRGFRAPPRSDGKNFATWTLFELIRKLDSKEIKTWTQLALDLGVEPPSMEKRQSTQKVQQYSVRLKRWMRAMHIDAFFEYLLGKQHNYYLQVPPPHDPFPESGRDGVPLEEDLAIRALDPKFKPKRGRRKADEHDEDGDASSPPPKRPHLDTSIVFSPAQGFAHPHSAFPGSALAMSAHPDDMDRFGGHHDPWAAVSTIAPASMQSKHLVPHSAFPGGSGQALRWRLHTQDGPSTPHPLSAITPSHGQTAETAFDREPQSAITPSTSSAGKPRSRRRHGPAVSSAWSSNSNTPNGKLRGRPPSNRSVRDGPFVTFPANPNAKEGPIIELTRQTTPGSTARAQSVGTVASNETRASAEQPIRLPSEAGLSGNTAHVERTQSSTTSGAPTSSDAQAPSQPSAPPPKSQPPTRPSRLQLQVPQHVGGPVHLITPTVVVNGDTDSPKGANNSAAPAPAVTPSQRQLNPHSLQPGPTQPSHLITSSNTPTLPSLQPSNLSRALAKDLLGAVIDPPTSRRRLRGTDARALARTILTRLGLREDATPAADAASVIAVASWLGLAGQLGAGAAAVGPVGGVKRVRARRWRVRGDGFESPLDEGGGGGGETSEGGEAGEAGATVRESFDVAWAVHLGGVTGEFEIRGLGLGEKGEVDGSSGLVAVGDGGAVGEEEEEDEVQGAEGGHWREKCLKARKELSAQRDELKRIKEAVLDVVV